LRSPGSAWHVQAMPAARSESKTIPKALILIALVLVGAGVAAFILHARKPAKPDLAHAAQLYVANCAGCHGDKMQGQPDWRRLNAQGRLPAPPLDGTGHAWRHSDAELLHIMRFSVLDQAGPDYKTDMPAFDGKLSGDDLKGLVAFIRNSWPPGVQAAQSFLNPNREGMPDRVDGDWRLPPDCDEPVRGKPATLSAPPTQ
jgi:mono/diheme cytochrome c family protein